MPTSRVLHFKSWSVLVLTVALAAAPHLCSGQAHVETNEVNPLGAVYLPPHGRPIIGLPCRTGEFDLDGDGICTYDNCRSVVNPNQRNTDFDTMVR